MILRKLLLTAVLVVLVNTNDTAYVTVSFLYSLMVLLVLGYYKPYVSPMLDKLQTWLCFVTCLTEF